MSSFKSQSHLSLAFLKLRECNVTVRKLELIFLLHQPTTTMTGETVLITGITGFLATHVLDVTLASKENYQVRGTLRSKSKEEAVFARLSPSDRSRVTLVEVKDTASSDLTEAIKGVDYILHTASSYQLNVEDAKRDLLQPAVEETLNVLRYANKEKSVKRIGITSSFAAVTDL